MNPFGFPVTAPVVAVFDEELEKILATTSIAYGAKLRNIERNPYVLFHFHHRTAARPEWQDASDDCGSFRIRARAEILEQDFAEALTWIGHRFRSVRAQPGLHERLGKSRLWRKLYLYYFSRKVIAASPLDVVEGPVPETTALREAERRRPQRPIDIVKRSILRRAPAVSITIADPEAGLYASEARIQAVFPNLVCAELPHDAAPLQSAGKKISVKACISAFAQSSDLGWLIHAAVLGVADVSCRQVRLHPRTAFSTIRPPGALGDLWIGLHSTVKGAKAAAASGVTPLSEEVLARAFEGRQ